MSVYILDPNALSRMAAVEGGEWLKQQTARPEDAYGFFVFKKAFEEMQAYCADTGSDPATLGNVEPSMFGGPLGDGAIYGSGGYSRYRVRHDGRIVFLRSWAKGKAEAAAAAGFDVE